MKQEKYFCDKCKKEVSYNELSSIVIEFKNFDYRSGSRNSYDLCPTCCEKLGLIKRVIKENKIIQEAQDIKEKLYDIFYQMIEDIRQQ